MEPVGNSMQQANEEDARTSIASETFTDSNKQAVQLPTIRYPSAPVLVDRQRGAYLPGVEYTFTQLQVAQATFRYPPTPPVEVGESSDRLPHSSCEAPALSHLNYTANEDTANSEKSSFHSLPTPPDLVPISEISPTNCSSTPQQNLTSDSTYYRKHHWSAEDINQAHCLPVMQQTVPWGTDGGPLIPSTMHHHGLKPNQILFSLPSGGHSSYSEGMLSLHLQVPSI